MTAKRVVLSPVPGHVVLAGMVCLGLGACAGNGATRPLAPEVRDDIGAPALAAEAERHAGRRSPLSRPLLQESVLRRLQNRDYVGLQVLLEQLRGEAVENPAVHEPTLVSAYLSFEREETHLGKRLDDWIDAFPDFAEPWLARAIHRDFLANKARGGAWSRDLTEDQRSLSDGYRAAATADAMASMQRNPENPMVYRTLIGLASGSGNELYERAVLAGLERFPASFTIPWRALFFLQPRWGGSYQAIDALVARTQAHADRNPRLHCLRGYRDYAIGRDLQTAKRHVSAMEAFSRAAGYCQGYGVGEFQMERARSARAAEQWAVALQAQRQADAEEEPHAAAIGEFRADLLRRAGRALESEQYDKAIQICRALSADDASEIEPIRCIAHAHQRAGHHEAASVALKDAVSHPGVEAEDWSRWVASHRYRRDDDEAVRAAHQWVQSGIAAPKALLMRGSALAAAALYGVALQDFSTACQTGEAEACALRDRLSEWLQRREEKAVIEAERLRSRIPQDDEPAQLLYAPDVEFPFEALIAKLEGQAEISFDVTAEGKVENLRVESSTNRIFEAAALAAVQNRQYRPTRRAGESVAERYQQVIIFSR